MACSPWMSGPKPQGCAVLEPERIKLVSGALLAGHTVRLASDWPVQGTPPAGVALAGAGEAADFALTLTPGKTAPEALHLVPRIGVLGVGCKRGTTADQLEAAFGGFLCQPMALPRRASAVRPALI